MAMNFANGVQFWSVKDNTPTNGDRLTDDESLVFVIAPTPAEAISSIAAAYTSFRLKITKA